MGGVPPAPAHEVQADEVLRAYMAAYDARDPARDGTGSVGCHRRGLHHDGGGGPEWSPLRYFLRASCPPGGLARRIVQGAYEGLPVFLTGPPEAFRAGVGRAGLTAVDLATVAARADVANGAAAWAEVAPETKLGHASSPEGLDKGSEKNDPVHGRRHTTAFGTSESAILRGSTSLDVRQLTPA